MSRAATVQVVRRRAEQVLSSLSLGLVSQGLAFVVGVLVVRTLDRAMYVEYSLSGALSSAVLIVADSGIASTLTAAAARAENAGRFAPLFAAALRWRRVVWGAAIVPTLALLLYLLLRAGSPVLVAVLVAVLTGALSYNSLSISLVSIDYQLSGQFRVLQGLEAASGAARLVLVGLGAVLGVRTVLYFLALALVLGTLQRVLMSRQVRARHPPGPASAADLLLFRRAVHSTLASTVFLIVGEQLQNVILVQRGNPLAIADITALGRFALAFGLVNIVSGNLAVPYLARAGTSRATVVRRAGVVVLTYGAVCIAFVLGVILFEPLLLVILGPRYDRLETELVLVSIGAAVANFGVYGIGVVVHARGWLTWSWTYGVFLALWAAWGLFVADVSTTTGAAVLAAALSLPSLLSNLVRLLVGFRTLPPESADRPPSGAPPPGAVPPDGT